MSERPEIHKCWHCGNPNTVVNSRDTGRIEVTYRHYTYCAKCKCRGPMAETVDEAIGLHNIIIIGEKVANSTRK